MQDHTPFFIILIVVTALINGVAALPAFFAKKYEAGLGVGIAATIIQIVISYMVSLGLIRIALAFVDREKPSIWQLFTTLPKVGSYFIASTLYSIMLFFGLLLLVVPGCIWGLRYILYPYFIVDKGAGPIEALKMSSEATMGAKWDLFAYAIVSSTIYLLGVVCLLIGLFVAIPVLMIAQALIYRRLAG